jgi:hypothetical protein
MTRPTITEKAQRLLTTGHVFIRWSTPEVVAAAVRGDTGVHDVDLHSGRWSCSCAARVTCSHLQAVMLVTVPMTPTPTPTERTQS